MGCLGQLRNDVADHNAAADLEAAGGGGACRAHGGPHSRLEGQAVRRTGARKGVVERGGGVAEGRRGVAALGARLLRLGVAMEPSVVGTQAYLRHLNGLDAERLAATVCEVAAAEGASRA